MAHITSCRICDSTDLEPVVNLGEQPWCNHFLSKEEVGNEQFYPLHVVYCRHCSTSQLDYTVPKEVMFGDHTYLSGTTRSLSEHFKNVASEVDAVFGGDKQHKSVLDIGSNDGTQLKHFKALRYDVLGVESSKTTAEIASAADVNTLNAFFNYDLAQSLNRKFDVINAAGVFFHLEELHSVTDGIRLVLAEDGVFVVQFLYMKSIMENVAFDQIYHEHLLYYNLKNISYLLEAHGLQLFDASLSPIHGGSIIGYATHKGKRVQTERLQAMIAAEEAQKSNDISSYFTFARRIEEMKARNRAYLEEAKAKNQVVYGFGAPAKGNTLLNYFDIGPELIQFLVEKNSLRKGLYSPGKHIPIILEEEVSPLPDIYYILAWNFKKEILANNQRLIDDGVEFYFPVNPESAV